MASNASQTGNNPPPKPWERAISSSGPAPFKPSTPGTTSVVVETSGTAKPGEVVSNAEHTAANTSVVARSLPSRPWDRNYGNNYGGYGSSVNYNTGYGSGMYGSSGGFGGSYGGGLYGNSMYRGGYGGVSGGYGMNGGVYSSGFGGPIGGYGASPYGNPYPNNPYEEPPSPPGFWMSLLRVMNGVVNFFGRISMLVDQNTQAFHLFMTALLQLFDRSGMLYGELARFVLRLLGIRTKPKQLHQPGPGQVEGREQRFVEGAKAPGPSWDSVWGGDDAIKGTR